MDYTKKFWLFVGNDYCPDGGIRDLYDTYEYKDEAIEVVNELKYYDWAHIVHVDSGEVRWYAYNIDAEVWEIR